MTEVESGLLKLKGLIYDMPPEDRKKIEDTVASINKVIADLDEQTRFICLSLVFGQAHIDAEKKGSF